MFSKSVKVPCNLAAVPAPLSSCKTQPLSISVTSSSTKIVKALFSDQPARIITSSTTLSTPETE